MIARYTAAKRNEVIESVKAFPNESYDQIAKLNNVSPATVSRWMRESVSPKKARGYPSRTYRATEALKTEAMKRLIVNPYLPNSILMPELGVGSALLASCRKGLREMSVSRREAFIARHNLATSGTQAELPLAKEEPEVEVYRADPAPAPAPLTGGSSSYYSVPINNPTSGTGRYVAECNDIIEALEMDFRTGNTFKAIWRLALAKQGRGKRGTTALYDAEKILFFAEREVANLKGK